MRLAPLLPLLLLLACGSDAAGTDAGPRPVDAPAPADPFATDEPLTTAPSCPAPSGEPQDVLSLARLRAEGTSATLFEWIREERDAIATVRDDVNDNGWIPRSGVLARAEIDFGPITGRAVALRSVSLEWTGAVPRAQIRVRASCGGPLVARVDVSGDRAELGDVCASCLELVVLGDGDTRLRSLRVESADPSLTLPPVAPPPTVADIRHPELGVIEGFYGVPWSWEERARVVDTLSRAGLGLYVYAPKNDPLHRAEWRTPYPAEFVQRFGELADFAAARAVSTVIAVSPFIDYDESSTDRAALIAKLRALVDAGADGIALFADDIEFENTRPIDGNLGALHARVSNEVLAALREGNPNLQLWFVGTVYSDDRIRMWESSIAYLEALRALDPSVRVLWTGTDTFSPSLAAADLATVRTAIGRDPAIWDNYWANDGGDGLLGRLPLGAYEQRDRDLIAGTTGIGQNPVIQGSLARIAVGTFAEWANDPAADSAAMRAAASIAEARYAFGASADPVRDAAVVRRLLETFDAPTNGQPADAALGGALERIGNSLGSPAVADLALALDRLAVAYTLRSALHHSGVANDVVDDSEGGLLKVEPGAEVGLLSFERVAALQAGEDAAATTRALQDLDRAVEGRSRFRWMEVPLHALAESALRFSASGSRPRPALGEPLPRCVVGSPVEFAPFGGATETRVHGLAGASVVGERVQWTAPHPGRFEAAFIAPPTESSGARVRTETIVCVPAS